MLPIEDAMATIVFVRGTLESFKAKVTSIMIKITKHCASIHVIRIPDSTAVNTKRTMKRQRS